MAGHPSAQIFDNSGAAHPDTELVTLRRDHLGMVGDIERNLHAVGTALPFFIAHAERAVLRVRTAAP